MPEFQYDNKRRSNKGRYAWNNVKDLLDYTKQENCISSMSLIFLPIFDDKKTLEIKFSVEELLDLYYSHDKKIIELIHKNNPSFSIKNLERQLTNRFHLIAAIESFILSYIEIIEDKDILKIATSTFAFALGNQKERENILLLFSRIIDYIKHNN